MSARRRVFPFPGEFSIFPSMTKAFSYDLIVIGSGPAGEKAALHAALHGKRVVLVERQAILGGAGVNTGTIPSKTLKATAEHLSALSQDGLPGSRGRIERDTNARNVFFRERKVVNQERKQVSRQLLLDRVEVVHGDASLLEAHRVEVVAEGKSQVFDSEFVLIATGSSPAHPEGVPFDGDSVHDSDTILQIDRIPESLCIVGAGVIGCEYATIFAALGTKVTLINEHTGILPFIDAEVVSLLSEEMQRGGVEFRFGTRLESVSILPGNRSRVRAQLADGGSLEAEMFLYAAGRGGNTKDLGCDRLGLEVSERGNLSVDSTYATKVPNVYAVGDVIGFPALGSTSMDQGRVAVTHMFGLHSLERIATAIPYGIYTIPEVSMVGLTEAAARKKGVEFAVIRVDYADIPRGTIMGVEHGFLKLVYDRQDHTILGVHIIGPHATELIHYGMQLVEDHKTLTHITSEVFNFPTLHELYKQAAYAAWNDA